MKLSVKSGGKTAEFEVGNNLQEKTALFGAALVDAHANKSIRDQARRILTKLIEDETSDAEIAQYFKSFKPIMPGRQRMTPQEKIVNAFNGLTPEQQQIVRMALQKAGK